MRILLVLLMTAASGFAQDHDRLFVLNKSGDTLSIVNAVSMSVERTVPTGGNPHEMAIAPNGMKAYIANVGDNTVSVLDLKTFAVTKQIRNPDFQYPHGIVFTPDSRRALVTNDRGGIPVRWAPTVPCTVLARRPDTRTTAGGRRSGYDGSSRRSGGMADALA